MRSDYLQCRRGDRGRFADRHEGTGDTGLIGRRVRKKDAHYSCPRRAQGHVRDVPRAGSGPFPGYVCTNKGFGGP
jgi:hypothetical protein